LEGKLVTKQFYSVSRGMKIDGVVRRVSVCYPLTDNVAGTVRKLVESGMARIYNEEMRFVSGVPIPMKRVVPKPQAPAPVIEAAPAQVIESDPVPDPVPESDPGSDAQATAPEDESIPSSLGSEEAVSSEAPYSEPLLESGNLPEENSGEEAVESERSRKKRGSKQPA
jgi:hypothetical protein